MFKIKIKTSELGVFLLTLNAFPTFVLMFLLLTLNMPIPAG